MFYAFQPGDAAQHICRMFFRVLGYEPIVYARKPRSLLWLSQADWCPHRDPKADHWRQALPAIWKAFARSRPVAFMVWRSAAKLCSHYGPITASCAALSC